MEIKEPLGALLRSGPYQVTMVFMKSPLNLGRQNHVKNLSHRLENRQLERDLESATW